MKELSNEISTVEAAVADDKAVVTELNDRMQCNLAVTVIEASDLRDTETFGQIDPYVKLTIGTKEAPGGRCMERTTRVLENGGHERPIWNETLEFKGLPADHDNLIVDVYDDDVGSDDHLGTARMPLTGIFEAKEINLWLDLGDNGGNTAYRCGEIHLRFVYVAPDADLVAEFKEASAKLQVKQEQLRALKREERVLTAAATSRNNDNRGGGGSGSSSSSSSGSIRKSLQPPDLEPYRLLVHIYQAKNLPAADGNGTSD
eukprot:COSAG06_NODE_18352_length_891_cov_2.446970_1_plen_258_part_10